MFRSFIPFLLASLSFTLISWAAKLPLFEWQFSEIAAHYSSDCDGTLASHWTTRFGEDLEARDRPSVLENLNIVVKRSWNDETLDRMAISLYNGSPLLFIGVMLSIGYMWWFLLRDKQNRISHGVSAVFLTVLAVSLCFLLSQALRLGGPAIGQTPYYSEIRHCYGAITFSARLSKIHFKTLIVLFAAILSELGALWIIVRQMTLATLERKEKLNL